MARIEFSKATRSAAWDRSGGACEAEGPRYGLPPGVRCGADLTVKGIIYDHWDPVEQSQDATLANCVCACPACNRFKTSKIDIPMLAKGKRIFEKSVGLRKTKQPFPGSRDSKFKRHVDGSVSRR